MSEPLIGDYTNAAFTDLSQVYETLSGQHFTNCTFNRVDFTDAAFNKTVFEDCIFNACTFLNADLSRSTLKRCVISNSDFDMANLTAAQILDTKLFYSTFNYSNLFHSRFDTTEATECSFDHCDFRKCSRFDTPFINCTFRGTIGDNEEFFFAQIGGTSFTAHKDASRGAVVIFLEKHTLKSLTMPLGEHGTMPGIHTILAFIQDSTKEEGTI